MTTDRLRTLAADVPWDEHAFPVEEYRDRHRLVREAMAAASVDLLFLSSPEAICWLTGYRAEWYVTQSSTVWAPESGVAVHVDHDDWVHFEEEDELVLARITSVSTDLRIRTKENDPGSMRELIRAELKAAGWLGGRTGLELWSSRPNPAVSARFRALLESEGCEVVDGTSIVRTLRGRKSARELEKVRQAQAIADIGMRAAIDQMKPGMTELDVYAEVVYAMARAGGENPGITMPVASGHKSASVHGLAGRRTIEPGDIVNVDVSGVVDRYHANMARCVSMGEPTPAVRSRIEAVTGAVGVVGDLLEPGLPVRRLLDTVDAYYRDAGILDEAWWIGGYELGIAFPPDWVGEFVYESTVDPGDARFAPGTVVNYEANFYLPEGAGLAMCINTMAFAENEAAFLQTTPPGLIVIE